MPFPVIEDRFERRVEIRVLVQIFVEEVQKGIGGEGAGPAIGDYGAGGRS